MELKVKPNFARIATAEFLTLLGKFGLLLIVAYGYEVLPNYVDVSLFISDEVYTSSQFYIHLILFVMGFLNALFPFIGNLYDYYKTSYYVTADGVRMLRTIVFAHQEHTPRVQIMDVAMDKDWHLDKYFNTGTITFITSGEEQTYVKIPSIKDPQRVFEEVLIMLEFEKQKFTDINHQELASDQGIAMTKIEDTVPETDTSETDVSSKTQ